MMSVFAPLGRLGIMGSNFVKLQTVLQMQDQQASSFPITSVNALKVFTGTKISKLVMLIAIKN